ncbi:N-acetyltransferase [Tetragenococcus koreensis]|uniref:GNAT family acetyltransferase n=1 Tax=Tetragenococcus koreensis TaxID=290335 RepID=A0AAN4RJ81_9ENTE|nr:N-acetyltransferase [Tetragenococcus koreensis]MCF1617997.1 N-acetyltransferase [Tetragenococcus koreensis]MCF1622854.1 N-acetyltransferase [Tetragenococcus koreensis]MCF1626257.1 N-acetyltransferase [Tetragenococcus koreensis]MCF1630816.1 N-acetyltransferase [Tetragenococcus koreensis]MCF1679123.1 N-acetyltransferase [Tetragenococcus koreensis]
MIRKLQKEDLTAVLSIWLKENIQAHDFISDTYWNSQSDSVKEQLPQSEVYVYIDNNDKIVGFIGLIDYYIAGFFIDSTKQSRGIGKQLLDYCKAKKAKLTLEAYQKNQRAIRFYQREGFVTKDETIDEDTGEKEFVMVWENSD